MAPICGCSTLARSCFPPGPLSGSPRRTWWCEELQAENQAETRCHARVGERNGAENSSAYVDIYELRVMFAELRRDVVSNLDRLSAGRRLFWIEMQTKLYPAHNQTIKIQPWCYVWTSFQYPVSRGLSSCRPAFPPSSLETSRATRGGEMTGSQTGRGSLDVGFLVSWFNCRVLGRKKVCSPPKSESQYLHAHVNK